MLHNRWESNGTRISRIQKKEEQRKKVKHKFCVKIVSAFCFKKEKRAKGAQQALLTSFTHSEQREHSHSTYI